MKNYAPFVDRSCNESFLLFFFLIVTVCTVLLPRRLRKKKGMKGERVVIVKMLTEIYLSLLL